MTEDLDRLRKLILAALPEDTSLHGGSPQLRYTYLPTAHMKALRPDSMLVAGNRGSGKSFWWAALQESELRGAIGGRVGIRRDTLVSTGFGEASSPDNYPGKDTIATLLDQFDARRVWQTVVLKHVADGEILEEFRSLRTWQERVKWVCGHPEEVERCLFEADQRLAVADQFHMILFDALDRTADKWERMHALVRGLLQVLLDFRSYQRIRLKVFVRPDQIEDRSVSTFPDSSKVLAQKTDLTWPRKDLYGLLWQYLANEPNEGQVFRDLSAREVDAQWNMQDGVWTVPEVLSSQEETQKKLFHAITGPWMGRDRRRGFPYSWLPNHLGDANRQVSPRSFLAAIRHAASDPPRADQENALHYESIKRGVQKASTIRVREIEEDYPWVRTLFMPLKGISVPCPFDDIEQSWRNRGVLEELQQSIGRPEGVRLPPRHIHLGPKGVFEDLKELGLMEETSDGRANLPDVYRIGYGIGRRGGVRPVAR